MRRLGTLAVGAVLLVAAALLVRGDVPCGLLSLQPACQIAMQPGPTQDTLGLVTIDGAPTYVPDGGELLLTTVEVRDGLTWSSWLAARRSPVMDTLPREQVYPAGIERTELHQQNAALMADSQLVATIAALEEVGYQLRGEGALVAAVTTDAVTTELEVGDVITAVDGAPVQESGDVVAAVRASAPGEVLRLAVTGPTGGRTVEVVLGASPDDPALAYVGVLLSTRLELPVEVDIRAGTIGGPSAGLVFALSLVELLEPEDLLDARVVAGTGTIDRDGVVGTVGGIRQKIAAATAPGEGREPASVFLVPRGNLAEASRATVTSDVLVVPVDTLAEGLAALAALRVGHEPDGALVLAAAG